MPQAPFDLFSRKKKAARYDRVLKRFSSVFYATFVGRKKSNIYDFSLSILMHFVEFFIAQA